MFACYQQVGLYLMGVVCVWLLWCGCEVYLFAVFDGRGVVDAIAWPFFGGL